jgi:hypothetical protein
VSCTPSTGLRGSGGWSDKQTAPHTIRQLAKFPRNIRRKVMEAHSASLTPYVPALLRHGNPGRCVPSIELPYKSDIRFVFFILLSFGNSF